MSEVPNNGCFVSNNKKILQFIEDITSRADQIQKDVVEEILSSNCYVEYLQLCGLNGHTDSENFKKLIPVIQYEDIQIYINRIANGDTSTIICSNHISEFLVSSGTSGGESKLIPTTEDDGNRRSLLSRLFMPVMSQFIPNLDKGKAMRFLFIRYEVKTPGGLVARPAATSYYKSSHFKNRPYNPYTSPNETILCPDSFQSMYSQMLCGLCQHDEVHSVGAVFASGFIHAIRFLEKHWPMMCSDIRNGTISSQITDVSVREAVMKILINPNPKLADFIESECGKSSWQGIITRLWRNTKYVDAIVTGTMSQYISTLDYYSNGLPIASTMYACSEGYFGVNLNPLCEPSEVLYTLIPNMAYYEFLPINRMDGVVKEQLQELVDLVDVKLGHEYELVVTTYAGLYRYRVGDVLRVAGFKNKAPQFSFICRRNVVLSIDCEKTDEVDLQNAMKNAGNNLIPFDASVSEYTSYADTTTIPGHYVLFWEIRCKRSAPISSAVYEDCCLTVEESLNSVYRYSRVSDKSIGPLEIKIVKVGTFDKLMDYAMGLGASMSQYKTPRCVKSAAMVELLNSRVVASYFSPKSPKWAAGHKQWYNNS